MLDAVRKPPIRKDSPFSSAVAFYPSCTGAAMDTTTPLLILMGDADVYSNYAACQKDAGSTSNEHPIVLKKYAGAKHGFDWKKGAPERSAFGYDPVAHKDAIAEVERFLALGFDQ